MNKTSPFIFNGKLYYIGTVVKVKEGFEQYFKFNSMLQFTGYIIDEKAYCFSSLQDKWEVYRLSSRQVSEYIDKVLQANVVEYNDNKENIQHIEGIVSAWIWYILIMFFALFFKGVGNVIMTWLFATFIFFSWRHRKIKGG